MSYCKYLFVLFAVLMAALPVQADEVQQLIFADNLKRAEAGDANAQFVVGHRYEIGVGTEKNMEKAFEWYSKAAQKGHPLASSRRGAQRGCRQGSSCTPRQRGGTPAEQQSRTEAEARNKAQQAEAARNKASRPSRPRWRASAKPLRRPNSPPWRRPSGRRQSRQAGDRHQNGGGRQRKPGQRHGCRARQPVAGQQNFGRNPAVANTSCLRTATAEVTCFTGESQQTVGTTNCPIP